MILITLFNYGVSYKFTILVATGIIAYIDGKSAYNKNEMNSYGLDIL